MGWFPARTKERHKADYAKLRINLLMQRKLLCKVTFLKPIIQRFFNPITLHNIRFTLDHTAKKVMFHPCSNLEDCHRLDLDKHFQWLFVLSLYPF